MNCHKNLETADIRLPEILSGRPCATAKLCGDKSHPNLSGMVRFYQINAGDLPPLFENNGLAVSVFLTNRFSVNQIIGKTIIIHDKPDDFTTDPSGNSGTKIACGVIVEF